MEQHNRQDDLPVHSARAQTRHFSKVTEPVRERETFKYYSSLYAGNIVKNHDSATSPDELITCQDPVLTALALTGAVQTNTDRSLISLFDSTHQYIVAEATPKTRLLPSATGAECESPLWLCGTAIPRSQGVCELSLLGTDALTSDENKPTMSQELPLTISDDLVLDARFCRKPYCQPGTLCRFYAAVPIRTRRGINIGVYCVINENPGKVWADADTQRLRDISYAIMDHLESKRLGELHRRNERMNRGLGSFIEGKSTIKGWNTVPNAVSYFDLPISEATATINPTLPTLTDSPGEKKPAAAAAVFDNDNDNVPPAETEDKEQPPSPVTPITEHVDLDNNNLESIQQPALQIEDQSVVVPVDDEVDRTTISQEDEEEEEEEEEEETPTLILSKAANIIRESTEVEGCVFIDAAMEAYRSPSTANIIDDGIANFSSASSGDDSMDQAAREQQWSNCKVLAHSISDSSSAVGTPRPLIATKVPEKFVAKLLQRYPKGKIFNLGPDGELHSSEEDGVLSSDAEKRPSVGSQVIDLLTTPKTNKHMRKPWARNNEGAIIAAAFPLARSVAFVPIWNPRKDRWYAAGFIYTNSETRIFTTKGELSYLTALGVLTMADILRTTDVQADKAKSDVLGALSHELRSPLHGVILSAELLVDTDLSVFQGNVAHTIEICSRTLLDTIDHLLDYSGINNVTKKGKTSETGWKSRISGDKHKSQPGPQSLSCLSRLDGLVEEVVESVFAGHTFQFLAAAQLADKMSNSIENASQDPKTLDPMKAIAQFGPVQTVTGEHGGEKIGNVAVILSIDIRQNWSYFVQVGAIRRIIMNIFGNALKYTRQGSIKVSLTQEVASVQRRKKEPVVKFTVQDTGKGIGADFLRHGLFRPFSQEDSLTPGTGLGLSIVKQIVAQLRGSISIRSQVGIGTKVSILLPLEQAQESPETSNSASDDDRIFEEQIQDLRGLRIGLSLSKEGDTLPDWQKAISDTCAKWLHMEVVSGAPHTAKPDLQLWSDAALPDLSESYKTIAKTPNVVICSNALAASRQSKTFAASHHSAIFEFIAQPIGPRKLARALLLAYTRWMNVIESPTSSESGAKSSSRTPKGPTKVPEIIEPRPPVNRDISFPESVDSAMTEESIFSSSGAPPSSTTTDDTPLTTPDTCSKFLLVDDNHINLKVLSTYMKKLGLAYDTAMNGKDAVDLFTVGQSAYTCVLMDISMPIMDGFEAARCIRAHEERSGLKRVPIVALSGLASEDAYREALGSGMDLFLTKPVKLKELGNILESAGIMTI